MVVQLFEYTPNHWLIHFKCIHSMMYELYLKKVISYLKKETVFWGIITNVMKKTYTQNLKTITMFKNIRKEKKTVVSHMINNVTLFKIVFTDC